jgi:hypothetical protein
MRYNIMMTRAHKANAPSDHSRPMPCHATITFFSSSLIVFFFVCMHHGIHY